MVAENRQDNLDQRIEDLNKLFAQNRDLMVRARDLRRDPKAHAGKDYSQTPGYRDIDLKRYEMQHKKYTQQMNELMKEKSKRRNVGEILANRSVSDREKAVKERIEGGLAKGREMAVDRFGGGKDLQKMSGSIMDMLQRQATQGLGAQQFRQIRSDAAAQLASQQKMGLRNLLAQQGASGIRGAAAQAGMGQLQQAGAMARSGLEANLASQDIGLRQAGMQALRDAVNRERLGQLSTEFGVAGLFGQARSQAMQEALAKAALEKNLPLPSLSNPYAANTSGGFLGQMRRGLDKI